MQPEEKGLHSESVDFEERVREETRMRERLVLAHLGKGRARVINHSSIGLDVYKDQDGI